MANIAVRALRLAARTQQPFLYVTQVRTNKMLKTYFLTFYLKIN